MLRIRILLPFLTLIAFTQAHAARKEMGFDINDVAVLFPLDSDDQPVPEIKLNGKNQRGQLVPSTVFSDLLRTATDAWISAPSNAAIMALDDWSIVGFRYDPCAPPNDIRDRSCIRELRLVAQPIGSFGPADSALHLVYKVGEGLPVADDELLVALLRLKKQSEKLLSMSTAGLPLGTHPLLATAVAQENKSVPQLFKAFIETYAKGAQLHKLTMMGLRDGSPIDWKFLGGNIENGRWIQGSIPNMAEGDSLAIELNLGGGAEVFTPVTADTSLSTEDFFNSNPDGVEGRMTTLDKAVHALENPSLSNRNTVDCVSCHTATSIRLDRNFKFSPFIAGLTAKVPMRITAFPAPQMLQAHPTHWNLRALGYFGSSATLSMRTVNEAARSAEKLNTILGLQAPGRDCSLVEQSVMSCFVESSHLFGTVTSSADCLKACRL